MTRILIVFLFSVSAVSMLIFSTAHFGVGVIADGVSYLDTAQSLLAGKGPVLADGSLITHWPPLFPMVLAAFAKLLGVTPLIGARWLAVLLVGLLVITFNAILKELNASNKATFGLNLILIASPITLLFNQLLSEGLFLVLLSLNVFGLVRYLGTHSMRMLIGVALLTGFLTLTRYAGGAFIIATAIVVLFSKNNSTSILKRISVFAIFSVILPGIWLVYVRLFAMNESIREVHFHPVSTSHLWKLADTLSSWISPTGEDIHRIALLACCILIVMVFVFSRGKQALRAVLTFPLCTFAILSMVYVCFLFVSITFLDSSTPLDTRILSPLIIMIPLFIFQVLSKLKLSEGHKLTLAFLVGIFVMHNGGFTYVMHRGMHYSGSGFTGKEWQESETIKRIEKLNTGVIYSNGQDALSFFLPYAAQEGRIRQFPFRKSQFHDDVNSELQLDLDSMCFNVYERGASIVYFDKLSWRDYYANPELISEVCSVNISERFADGFIIAPKSDDQYQ